MRTISIIWERRLKESILHQDVYHKALLYIGSSILSTTPFEGIIKSIVFQHLGQGQTTAVGVKRMLVPTKVAGRPAGKRFPCKRTDYVNLWVLVVMAMSPKSLINHGRPSAGGSLALGEDECRFPCWVEELFNLLHFMFSRICHFL